jgi:hypothetical protein
MSLARRETCIHLFSSLIIPIIFIIVRPSSIFVMGTNEVGRDAAGFSLQANKSFSPCDAV